MGVGIIIIVLALLGILLFLKFSPGFRFGRTWTFVIGILIAFFVVSFGYVLTRAGVGDNLSSFGGIVNAFKVYFSWLGYFFDNATTITGNVVSSDWMGNMTGGKG